MKSAFVIMPIRPAGSDEHRHYKTLYTEFLKPALEQLNYDVTRADEVQRAGAISRDIILRLATADLVVADLTTWNPNVFYELGLRHCFRRVGTLMIVDEERTTSIPFDLQAYRVIKFKGSLDGIGQLGRELRSYVETLDTDSLVDATGDNPVHDWLPQLPPNAIAATNENHQAARLAQLSELVRTYQDRFGTIDPSQHADAAHSPLSVLEAAIAEAEQGNLPMDLLERSRSAVSEQDYRGFLQATRRMLEIRQFAPTDDQFVEMASLAQILGLRQIQMAILRHAMDVDGSEKVEQAYIASLAHSTDVKERDEARERIAEKLSIDIRADPPTVPDTWTQTQIGLCAIMLDSYHADGLHEDAADLARTVVDVYPHSEIAMRNYARSLARMHRDSDALQAFRAAVMLDGSSDDSARWYGNELHNRERHVDAIEAYALCCMRDARDGDNFANLAWEIGLAMEPSGRTSGRTLPNDLGPRQGEIAILCSLSCSRVSAVGRGYLEKAVESLEVDMQTLVQGERLSAADRYEFARSVYQCIQSELTRPPNPLEVPGLEHIEVSPREVLAHPTAIT